ncbi:MAG: family 16 glycosylhydrolase [Chitinophagaceae bacterium]
MKTINLIKLLSIVLFFSFLASCQKSVPEIENPSPPVIVPSGTDTGLYYNAKTICDHTYNEAALTASGWTKSFEDNFGSNLSNWTLLRGGNASKELQYFKESNVRVESGFAQILTKKESVTTTVSGSARTFDYTSGLMKSNATFSANEATPRIRIAARLRLPQGYGLQPTFTATGDDYPKNGHIGIMTSYSNQPNFYTTDYAYGTANTNLVRNANGYITADADLTACYHVYETEWTKNGLNFYLDGKLVEQKTSGGYIPALFGKKLQLHLYVVIISDLLTRPQIKTGTLSVDWVKVFTSKS